MVHRYKIGGGLQIISCFFLMATFVVYCCLPSLQNLHGKTLMCHVASLFVAYATLAVEAFMTGSWIDMYDPSVSNLLCKFLGAYYINLRNRNIDHPIYRHSYIYIYFFIAYLLLLGFHSAFFWLNVMCFDIWWTFR